MHAVREILTRSGGRRHLGLAGAAFAVFCAVVPKPLGANGERTISLYNVHTKQTLSIAYKRNGQYIPAAMKKLDWHLRDWRRNEPTRMDPQVIDLVWEIHAELGSRMPVHVISAYRSPKTNNMLRRKRGGQARRSQHLLGKAIDVRFPDIPARRLRYSALLREQGGVGYYPTSATPFVHVDTGRVRHWPRMGRQELALLFPHGRTKHRPRGGGAITRRDADAARRSNPLLARRVAAFHQNRHSGSRTTRLAAAVPRPAAVRRPIAVPAPQLVRRARIAYAAPRPAPKALQRSAPRAAARSVAQRPRLPVGGGGWNATLRPPAPKLPVLRPAPRRVAMRQPLPAPPKAVAADPKPLPFKPSQYAISSSDRSSLKRLTSALFGSSSPKPKPATLVMPPKPDEWISAPAFDEEHPEELFYRPFPIAPYITQTASADDLALQHMTSPEIDKTLVLLVEDGVDDPPLQLRPGLKTANLMWSQSFRGATVARASLPTPQPGLLSALTRRLVRLAGR